MVTVLILAIIAGLLYCVAMAVAGWLSWKDRKDWHFLVGCGLYSIAAVSLSYWLIGG